MKNLTESGKPEYKIVSIATTDRLADAPNSTPEYRSLVSDFLVRFCIAVTLLLVFLIAGELFSYFQHLPNAREAMEPAINRKLSNASDSEREYWSQYDAADKFTYFPFVLWRRRPFHGSMINVNGDGIRQTTHTECGDSNFTIWMFGDSTLWGAGSTDDETIPSFLAAKYEQAGRKVCIVNYGEGAWVNTQEVVELTQQLKHTAHKPDVVIFYDGGNEAFTAYQSGHADIPSNYSSFKAYLEGWSAEQKPGFLYLRKTNTHRLLEKVASKLSFGHNQPAAAMTDDQVEALADGILQNYQQNMDIVGLLAQRFGFKPIFTWYPILIVGHKPLTQFEKAVEPAQEQSYPGVTRLYRAAYRHCEQTRRENLYCLTDVFDDQPELLFRGMSHVYPEANRIVVDRLFQILEHPQRPSSINNSHSSQPVRHRAGPA